MKNAILRNTIYFIKMDCAKFLKIKIKNFTDTLKSGMICHGLNFLKRFCCCVHWCVENLKKLIQISKNIECVGVFI